MPKQVEICVPLVHNDGMRISGNKRAAEHLLLTRRYGGMTIIRDCDGLWLSPARTIKGESVEVWRIVVAPNEYNSDWWLSYKRHLETAFAQETILITVSDVEIV